MNKKVNDVEEVTKVDNTTGPKTYDQKLSDYKEHFNDLGMHDPSTKARIQAMETATPRDDVDNLERAPDLVERDRVREEKAKELEKVKDERKEDNEILSDKMVEEKAKDVKQTEAERAKEVKPVVTEKSEENKSKKNNNEK